MSCTARGGPPAPRGGVAPGAERAPPWPPAPPIHPHPSPADAARAVPNRPPRGAAAADGGRRRASSSAWVGAATPPLGGKARAVTWSRRDPAGGGGDRGAVKAPRRKQRRRDRFAGRGGENRLLRFGGTSVAPIKSNKRTPRIIATNTSCRIVCHEAQEQCGTIVRASAENVAQGPNHLCQKHVCFCVLRGEREICNPPRPAARGSVKAGFVASVCFTGKDAFLLVHRETQDKTWALLPF